MSFPKEKFCAFHSDLSNSLQLLIKSNYILFDLWRRCEAEQNLRFAYVQTFYTHFPEYVDDDVYDKLEFAGKNIFYGLNAYLSINVSCSMEELIEFIDSFLTHQLDEFLNDYEIPEWCDENYESKEHKKEIERQQIVSSRPASQVLL